MTHALYVHEVRDMLQLDFSLTIGLYGGDLITEDDVRRRDSQIIVQAWEQLNSKPTDGTVYVKDLIPKAVDVAIDVLGEVNQHEGPGQRAVSPREIDCLIASPSPLAKELGGRLLSFDRTLKTWSKLDVTGFDLAMTFGKLAKGLMYSLVGSSEGDQPLLPFHAQVVGHRLDASSHSDVCRALALSPQKFGKDTVVDFGPPIDFYAALTPYTDPQAPIVDAADRRLRLEMSRGLWNAHVWTIGTATGASTWPWLPLIEAVIAADRPLLDKFVGSGVDACALAKVFGAESTDDSGQFAWNTALVPVLSIGTAPDGSIAGILSCAVWT